MKLVMLEGVSINTEKYNKLIVDGYYSRSGWFPIAEGTPVDNEGFPVSDEFKLIKTVKKSTVMFVPDNTRGDERVVIAGQVWGGFRGGASIEESSTATVLWEVTSSKHCKGCVAFLALISPSEQLLVNGYGRRYNKIFVFKNENGELKQEEYEADEYEAMQGLTTDAVEEL